MRARTPDLKWTAALSLLVVALSALPGLVVPAGVLVPAGALVPTPPYPADVVLESLSPDLPRPGGQVQLKGRVVNTSAATLEDVQVRLRLSRSRLSRRGQVDEIAAGADIKPGVHLEGTLVDLRGELPPGAAAAFDLRVPTERLLLGEFGVYVLGVEALASEQRAGLARTFLTWAPRRSEARPSRAVWLWPLVDVPHRDAAGTFNDDSLAASLRPGGRLHRLLSAAADGRFSVSWVIDPMLLEDVVAMADRPYLVRTEDGPQPGTGSAVAASWLSALRSATSHDEVYTLPYADPDLVALTHRGQREPVRRAVADGARIGSQVLGRRVRSDLAWPANGALDPATGRLLAQAKLGAVVLRESSVPPEPLPPYTPDARAQLRVGDGETLDALLYDERLSAAVSDPTDGAQGRRLPVQRFLAETAMLVAERPSVPRTVLVAPNPRWDPRPDYLDQLLDLAGSAWWLHSARLSELRATAPPALSRRPLSYPPDAAARELPADYLRRVDALEREATTLAQIVDVQQPNPPAASPATDQLVDDPLGPQAITAVQRLRSSAYRGAAGQRNRALSALAEGLRGQAGKVRLVPGGVTLGDREGSIPVTVVNDLDRPVRVQVALTPTSPRLTITDRPVVSVPARRNRTVLVPARALSNGLVMVTGQLRTPSGTDYGRPVEVPVRVFTVGAIGLYVTVAAALLLFLRAGITVLRRARRSRRAAQPAVPPAGRTHEQDPANETVGS